jgi:two-component system sensor histidine kinase CiaH
MLACVSKRKKADMVDNSKKRLRQATVIYWVLLFYIIAALVWWLLSLEQQSRQIFELKSEIITNTYATVNSDLYEQELKKITNNYRRDKTKYISEGITFLALIIIGAAYIYRLVRKQFRLQQQQQNFVMAVTHELKTPLSVSRLNLETLQKYQLDEEKRSKLLQMTLRETLRLDTLINNILIVSQLDGSSYKISKEELDLSNLANDVINQFSSRYPERKLVKRIKEETELDGDPLLLKLLISNLLENAHKYSPKDKSIELTLEHRDKEIILKVSDEGRGIPGKEKENIFEKFYRLGDEHTRTTQGTGLGLYLCRKIAKDHKGNITVEDNQPSGSTFIVRFAV